MKFPRNARIFRGQLDAAPFAAVFFLLAILLMLSSRVYPPGVALKLPVAAGLPGLDKPTLAIAVDANGHYYFQNQVIEENQLSGRLKQAVKEAPELPTLLIQADEAVSYKLLLRLGLLAREAGLSNAWLATLPRQVNSVR